MKRIYRKITIVTLVLASLTLMVLLILESIYSTTQEILITCNSILTFGFLVSALYGFHINKESARLETSIEFYNAAYKELQSSEFVKREYMIWEKLMKRNNKICAIEDIEDEDLRNSIFEYCEFLNGIGVLVVERIINIDVIMSYIGANTLQSYLLIKPYLELTRKKRSAQTPSAFSNDVNIILRDARMLSFAHFELFALEIQSNAPDLIKGFQHKLKKLKKITSNSNLSVHYEKR